MPQAIPAVIGAGASLLGARKAKKSADSDRRQQQEILDRLSEVSFDPQALFGPQGIGFDPATGEMSLGAFAPFQEMLGGLAESGIGQGFDIQQGALGAGLPAIQQLFGNALGLSDVALGGLGDANTDFLQQQFGSGMDFVSSLFGNATAEGQGIRDMAQLFGAGGADLRAEGAGIRGLGLEGLSAGDPMQALGQAFGLGGAGELMGRGSDFFGRSNFFGNEAQVGFEDLRAETLDLLRERDREGEDRAAAGLADELFGTGRLGVTGGGREISDFAQGLARADLDRQLAATGEARTTRESAGNLAGLFGQLGTGASSLAPGFANAGTSMFGAGTDLSRLGLGVLGAGTDLTGQGTALSSLMPSMINAGTSVSGLEQIPLSAMGQFGQNFGMAQELESALLNNAFNRFGSTSNLTNDLFAGMMGTGSGLLSQGAGALQSALGMSQLPLDFGTFAANLATTQANTEIAAAGGQNNVTANFGPSGNDLLASGLSNFGSNLFNSSGGFQSIVDGIGGIFNKGSSLTQDPNLAGADGGMFSPETLGGSGALISTSAFGPNPFRGVGG
jgi:hypothetical protein